MCRGKSCSGSKGVDSKSRGLSTRDSILPKIILQSLSSYTLVRSWSRLDLIMATPRRRRGQPAPVIKSHLYLTFHVHTVKRISQLTGNLRSRIVWRRLDAASVMSVLKIVETSHRVPHASSSATPAPGRPARMITARTFRNNKHSFSCRLQLIP